MLCYYKIRTTKQCYERGNLFMENNKLQTIKIEGMGRCSAGEYDEIHISGTGTFDGDVVCNGVWVSGMGTVNGNIRSKSIKVSGTAKVNGVTDADTIEVSGNFKSKSTLHANKLLIKGIVKAEDDLKVQEVLSSGMLTVANQLDCETIEVSGIITCNGLVNCERMQLNLAGTSNINEIGGSVVVVEDGKVGVGNLINKIIPKKYKLNKLVVNTIEGDEITLESVEAKMVRGRNIKIGKNCKIETVEYSNQVDVDADSEVQYSVQI